MDQRSQKVTWKWRARFRAKADSIPHWYELPRRMDVDLARKWAEVNRIDFDSDMERVEGSERMQ